MNLVYPIESRCTNCRLCEIACIVEHSRTKSPVGAYVVEGLRFNVERSADLPDPAEALAKGRPKPLNRCHVNVNGAISLSTACRHCEEPDCLLACKNGSLYKAPDGRVLLQEDRCVGCWMCLMACGFGAISRNPYVKNVPDVPSNGINHHCDLCPGRTVPACVMICPTGALVFEDRDPVEGGFPSRETGPRSERQGKGPEGSGTQYVIVGNSFAALFALEAIREQDPSRRILVISDEPWPAYSRAMIHEYLAGMVDEGKVSLRQPDYYQRMGVDLLLGHRVTGLDVANRRVLMNGDSVSFEKLLLAVGGTPFVPKIEGLEDFDFFTFTRLQDAIALREAADKVESIVVLGGGLIGLQCAEALAHLGKKVAVVELLDMILPMALDRTSARLVQAELEAEGIRIFTGDTIETLHGHDRQIERITLKSGATLPCQLLVVAVGVRPNVDFLRGSGLEIDRGIVVNERMETNVPGVYAAGDCAQGRELTTGRLMPIPIIPIASAHGRIAGLNMAGAERTFRGGLVSNALQFGGLQVISYGFVRDDGDGEVLRLLDERRKVYKKVILRENRVTGAVLVRAIDRAGLFRHLIEAQVNVRDFKHKLLDDDFNYAWLPQEERVMLFTVPH